MIPSLPEIPQQHVLAFAYDRADLEPRIVGSGRIVNEYWFDSELEPRPYVAVVECRDTDVAWRVAGRLQFGSRAVFTHSGAIQHAFRLGAKTRSFAG